MATVKLSHDICVAIWTRAAAQEFGVRLATDNIRKVQNALYDCRIKEGRPPKWENISIVLPEGGTEAWLVKEQVKEML